MKKLFGKYYDKALHAIAGILIAIIAIAAIKLLTNWSEFTAHVIAFNTVIAAGALKEYKDWKSYGRADMYDIIATFLGGLVVILIDKFLI